MPYSFWLLPSVLCSFSVELYPVGSGTATFSDYVKCRAYSGAGTMCKGISTPDFVPVVYQDRGRGEGRAIYAVG